MPEQPRSQTGSSDQVSVGDLVDYVKTYAKQETVGPLANAGKWLAWGSIGAISLGFGLAMLLLAILRLIQTEWRWASTGRWSFISYLIVLLAALVIVAIVVSRIQKTFLDKEDK